MCNIVASIESGPQFDFTVWDKLRYRVVAFDGNGKTYSISWGIDEIGQASVICGHVSELPGITKCDVEEYVQGDIHTRRLIITREEGMETFNAYK